MAVQALDPISVGARRTYDSRPESCHGVSISDAHAVRDPAGLIQHVDDSTSRAELLEPLHPQRGTAETLTGAFYELDAIVIVSNDRHAAVGEHRPLVSARQRIRGVGIPPAADMTADITRNGSPCAPRSR